MTATSFASLVTAYRLVACGLVAGGLVAGGLVGCSLVGCGSAAPVLPPAEVPAPEATPAATLMMRQELGSIDEEAVNATFDRLSGAFHDCYRQGLTRVRYLAGDVNVFLRVSAEGTARIVHLRESSLGERETERCLLDVLAKTPWPRPIGGEAEVKKHLGFDPPPGGKRPVEWPSEKVANVVHQLDSYARQCKQPGDGIFTVTAYVVTKGRKGRVLAAGIVSPSVEADARADCLLRLVESAHLPSPGRVAAKVSFPL